MNMLSYRGLSKTYVSTEREDVNESIFTDNPKKKKNMRDYVSKDSGPIFVLVLFIFCLNPSYRLLLIITSFLSPNRPISKNNNKK